MSQDSPEKVVKDSLDQAIRHLTLVDDTVERARRELRDAERARDKANDRVKQLHAALFVLRPDTEASVTEYVRKFKQANPR